MARELRIGLLILSALSTSSIIQANALVDGVVDRLSEYIQVDTTNPPGNEQRGVVYLSKILDASGISYKTVESAPARGNLWAKLEGGDKPALVLLHHIDVVPADPSYWSVDPYAGLVKEGYLYGRGALDMKSLGIVQLQAFLALHETGKRLNRDVIYLATADEEAGGYAGVGWLIENRPDLFDSVGFVLNEGGGGRFMGEDDVVFTVEVTQKIPVWLRLVARGNPGHGSAPQVETAVSRLIRAAYRLVDTRFKAEVIKPVREMFRGLAPYQDAGYVEAFRNIEDFVGDPDFMRSLQLVNPGLHALLRNTCSITVLQGSSKINVVPPEAVLELDCRVLPTQDVDGFIEQIQTLINDPNIEVERIMSFTPAVSSTTTSLFEAIRSTANKNYPEAKVIPGVTTGFTDSHFFRDIGIDSYGFAPFVLRPGEGSGIHGNDERIGIETLKEGTQLMIDLLQEFTTD